MHRTLFIHGLSVLLLAAAYLTFPATASANKGDVAYEVAEAEPAAEVPLTEASAANTDQAKPAGSTAVAATTETQPAQPEKIELDFKDADKDILTRQALDKLDVMVESLEFANAPLRNVIRIIGERLNINFIFDEANITGNVTLRLRNVRLRDALNSILSTRDLVIVPDKSGIFRIVPSAQVGMNKVETRTEVVQLNWIKAEDVAKSLTEFLTESVGRMQFNEEANVVIITDVPPQIEIIKNLISQIDRSERQVEIEARLVDVNIGALRNLGTNWNLSRVNQDALSKSTSTSQAQGTALYYVGPSESNPSGYVSGPTILKTTKTNILHGADVVGGSSTVTDLLSGDVVSESVDPVTAVAGMLTEGMSFDGEQGSLSFGEKVNILGGTYNLDMVFNALESRDVVEILANPRVTTLNNVPANIAIVEKIPYLESVSGPSQGTTTAQVEFEKVGVDIKVKPIITPNDYVRMEILLNQKIFRARVGNSDNSALNPPQVDERTASTNVIVMTDNTVAIGGLRQIRSLEGTTAVPWLHEIPVIGWLFKDKNYNQTKTDLLLMVTPRIIKGKATLTDVQKSYYDKIDMKWHLPDWFFDDVSTPDDK